MFSLLLLACSDPAPPPAPEPPPALPHVKLAIARPSAANAVAWVGVESGAWERHGLDVTIIQFSSSASAVEALAADTVDYALVGGVAVIKADFEGGDLTLLAGPLNRSVRRLVAGQDITSLEDLRGKRIALGDKGTGEAVAIQTALVAAGLPLDQVSWRYGKGGSLSVVRKDQAEAVSSTAPVDKLPELGLHVVLDLARDGGPYPALQLAARNGTAAGATASPLLAGLTEAMATYRDDRALALRVMDRHMALTDEAAAWSYDHEGPSLYSFPPEPDLAGLQRAIDHYAAHQPRYVGHQAAELVDTTALRALSLATPPAATDAP